MGEEEKAAEADGDAEEKKDDETKEEKKEDKKEEEEEKVELTEEEKALWYRKPYVPDIEQRVLGKSFASFSLPSEEEGFDEIRYLWGGAEACTTHLKDWVLELKKTQRVEDLEPSEWFREK